MIRITLVVAAVALAATSARAQDIKVPKSVLEAVWPDECTIELKDADTDNELQPLDGKLKLLEVYCWRAAYQAGSIFFAVDPAAPDKARLLRFAYWSTLKKRMDTMVSLASPDFDPNTKTLSMAYKGRGIGDCGQTGTWKWDGQDFRLTGFWSKPNCDGKPFDGEGKRWRV